MIYKDKKKYSEFLKDSLDYLENKGFENIKADLEGFETPKSYVKKGSDITITPDIVAEKEGRKHIFDISLKTEKPSLLNKLLATFWLNKLSSATSILMSDETTFPTKEL